MFYSSDFLDKKDFLDRFLSKKSKMDFLDFLSKKSAEFNVCLKNPPNLMFVQKISQYINSYISVNYIRINHLLIIIYIK